MRKRKQCPRIGMRRVRISVDRQRGSCASAEEEAVVVCPATDDAAPTNSPCPAMSCTN